MHSYIVTGASKGLGAALVRALLRPGNSVFGVSRSLNEALIAESNEAGVELHWVQADLAETLSIDAFMATIAERIELEGSESITLVNNAATLAPLGRIGASSDDEVEQGVRVNLIAPMILTHSFIRHFGGARVRRTVINVSSGAGIAPMPGLSTYSTTKAGLNMFTRAAAQEHGSDAEGSEFRFYAVSPGTVDTGMQESLREAGPSILPNHETYVEWKETGSLTSPEDAANAVLTLLDRDDMENGTFVHRSDLTTEDR
ncbi:MAG: SDR family NAD(P)-dependent oxidoreductase [Spirochaetota bacterium]